MVTDLFTLDEDDGVFEAMQATAEEHVRRAPVVDADGTLCGIVTLDDVLVLLVEEFARLAEIIRSESPPYCSGGGHRRGEVGSGRPAVPSRPESPPARARYCFAASISPFM